MMRLSIESSLPFVVVSLLVWGIGIPELQHQDPSVTTSDGERALDGLNSVAWADAKELIARSAGKKRHTANLYSPNINYY
eukprot:5953551-Amphidinium_carterae.1